MSTVKRRNGGDLRKRCRDLHREPSKWWVFTSNRWGFSKCLTVKHRSGGNLRRRGKCPPWSVEVVLNVHVDLNGGDLLNVHREPSKW